MPVRVISAAALLCLGASGAAQDVPAQDPPGQGALCSWAIYSALEEVGNRCFPGEDIELQAFAREGVKRHDAYMRANAGATDEQIAAFKHDQAGAGQSTEMVCAPGGAVELYKSARARPIEDLRRDFDRAIARPGKPSWGDCF